jgi:hypothetical protein
MATAGEWDPDNQAIWQEEIFDPERGSTRTITLRHPTYPFEEDATSEAELKRIAAAYLEKVHTLIGLPQLFEPHSPWFKVPLTWLPIKEQLIKELPIADSRGLVGSRWVQRYEKPSDHPAEGLIDRTAILLAAQSLEANDEKTVLSSRFGIRIVAHVSPEATPPWKVRITGCHRSTELATELVKLLEPHAGWVKAFLSNLLAETARLDNFFNAPIRVAAGLLEGTPIMIDGLRVLDASRRRALLEVYVSASRPIGKPSALPYALIMHLTVNDDAQIEGVELVEKSPLVADAIPSVNARLFQRDPASEPRGGTITGKIEDARPNRAPDELGCHCQSVDLPGLRLNGLGRAALSDDFGQVKVLQSKLVSTNADEDQIEIVEPAKVAHPRMNSFAALSGYQHARELFDTMRAYGFSPKQYFKLADLPLHVRYRAAIRPGPGKDGKAVNAQVDYDSPNATLHVNFALADLKRSTSRREPIGLTADPRWSWHEYGHVLLAASTGYLEFPFAHSAGDALAAIRSDPGSGLADRPGLRGLTFPWVYLNRRHDRSVYDGWSWCGTNHRPLRFPSGGVSQRHKGYESEQILSTSLFRLYRALGGDTVLATGKPDVKRRQEAADYAVYLIVRAIALLGPASAVPTETPDQFVSALVDADIGTWPGAHGPLKDRVGGCVHKLVRWAFEAQGLYATTDSLAVIDAPGEPPDVDVFIDNGRPDSEGGHPRGGYMPVSLDWNGARPLWHATANAIHVAGNQVTVEVLNRGRLPAAGVVVRVFWADWPDHWSDPPKWKTGRWTLLGAPSGPQQVPTGGAPSAFGPFPAPPTGSGRRLILAVASCAADRANCDQVTCLPCAMLPTPIVDLVAGDNNLGLCLDPR